MRVNKDIKEYIEVNGLKLTFVAGRSNMTIDKLSRIVNCKTKLGIEEYESICNGLQVDPTYFFQKKFLETKKMCS